MKGVYIILTMVALLAIAGCTHGNIEQNTNEGQGNENVCQECPQISSPGPEFCMDGKIVAGEVNECGCRAAPKCETNNGASLEQHTCTPEQKSATICTLEYAPVCGWFDQGIKCFAYPCAAAYGNKCQACAAPNVAYWTDGECPKVNDIVGGDGDEHGCIPSAGYTWCETKQKCLRQWEEKCTA